ncbi:hypothetical protein Sste5346_004827 [Sporothrix stenoceras]|uniref:Xylanolytic transcriptional activator regulatory domain-containing protein n=1 Tax=Sporothrix stenoceras TaxID=5173 RepID=A0ABR3Z6B0_9PEZI
MQHFNAGTVNRKVLLAICAVASRFVPPDDPARSGPDVQTDRGQQRGLNSACRANIAAQADAWAKEAKTLLVLEDMTLDTVVTALLLARHDINNGLFGSAWMLSSMATRAALALGLNRENHSLYRHQQNSTVTTNATIPFSEQETRRRLFWACYCLDRMMSTGLSDLTMLRAEHISLQLPCEEHHYLYGTSCWTTVPRLEWAREWVELGRDRDVGGGDDNNDDDFSSSGGESDGEGNNGPPLYDPLLESERDIGLFGRYVQIMEMRYCILHYVRNRYKASKAHTNSNHQRAQQQQQFRRHPRLSSSPSPQPPWSPSSWFARCKRKLTRWKRALPPQLQLLPDTVYARHAQDQLSALVMLHVWYDQCMSDLYRITMPGFPETLPADQLRLAPPGWVQQQQKACVRHSINIVTTLEMVAGIIDVDRCAPGSGRKEGCGGGENGGGRKHKGRRGFVFLDASLPMCVFDSIRVQLQWLFMQSPTADPAVAEARQSQCKENGEKLMGFVNSMTKYFRQAQWLLEEMRRMLQRHDVPIRQSANLCNTDSPSSDGGGHPWQRRIQQLQDDDVVQSGSGGTGTVPSPADSQQP